MSRMFQEDKEFWGPMAIVLGFTALSNSVTLCPTGNIIIPCPTGWVDFVIGLLLMGFGIGYVLCAFYAAPPKDRKLRSARILIPVGFSFFFFGIRIWSFNLIWGCITEAAAVIAMGLGFCLYCKYKRQEQEATPPNKKSKEV